MTFKISYASLKAARKNVWNASQSIAREHPKVVMEAAFAAAAAVTTVFAPIGISLLLVYASYKGLQTATRIGDDLDSDAGGGLYAACGVFAACAAFGWIPMNDIAAPVFMNTKAEGIVRTELARGASFVSDCESYGLMVPLTWRIERSQTCVEGAAIPNIPAIDGYISARVNGKPQFIKLETGVN